MQFVLENVTSHGARLGKLLFRDGRGVVETPFCLLYTRGGAVPHLADDVLGDVSEKPPAAILSLPHVYELPGTDVLTQYQQGIHSFSGLREQFLYLSVQDPCAPPPSGYNEEKSVTVWTNGGRKKLTVSDHLEFVEVSRPTAFECLCDSAPAIGSQPKRVRKSVDRTLRFLDQTLMARAGSKELQSSGVLGAVVGGDTEDERRRSAAETATRPVDGFVLEGFDLPHSRESRHSVLLSATQVLPVEKPRFIHGMGSPEEVFTAVESGVDVFDGSYPYTVTERSCAMVYPVSSCPFTTSSEVDRERVTSMEERVTSSMATDREEKGKGTGGDLPQLPRVTEIDLKEERYAADFTSLLPGCPCYSCQHHTRAYIHHLLATKEILASVLLMVHNLTHYISFFRCLRHALQNSSYSDFKHTCLSCS